MAAGGIGWIQIRAKRAADAELARTVERCARGTPGRRRALDRRSSRPGGALHVAGRARRPARTCRRPRREPWSGTRAGSAPRPTTSSRWRPPTPIPTSTWSRSARSFRPRHKEHPDPVVGLEALCARARSRPRSRWSRSAASPPTTWSRCSPPAPTRRCCSARSARGDVAANCDRLVSPGQHRRTAARRADLPHRLHGRRQDRGGEAAGAAAGAPVRRSRPRDRAALRPNHPRSLSRARRSRVPDARVRGARGVEQHCSGRDRHRRRRGRARAQRRGHAAHRPRALARRAVRYSAPAPGAVEGRAPAVQEPRAGAAALSIAPRRLRALRLEDRGRGGAGAPTTSRRWPNGWSGHRAISDLLRRPCLGGRASKRCCARCAASTSTSSCRWATWSATARRPTR